LNLRKPIKKALKKSAFLVVFLHQTFFDSLRSFIYKACRAVFFAREFLSALFDFKI